MSHQLPSVDMLHHTGDGQLRYVEVLTPGGVVRISTNLVDTHSGAPVVVVEVEQNILGRARTETGGDWDVEVSEHLTGSRTDIRLVKR
jgi:hypothetical protein